MNTAIAILIICTQIVSGPDYDPDIARAAHYTAFGGGLGGAYDPYTAALSEMEGRRVKTGGGRYRPEDGLSHPGAPTDWRYKELGLLAQGGFQDGGDYDPDIARAAHHTAGFGVRIGGPHPSYYRDIMKEGGGGYSGPPLTRQ